MREFYCSHCQTIEVVSESTCDVLHIHGSNTLGPLKFQLSQLQGAPVDGMDYKVRQFIKELHLVEFDPNKVYLILFNPVNIDIVKAVKAMEQFKLKIPPDSLFVPCKFSTNSEGFSTEMIAIESLDIIEEWLKERKSAMKEFHVPA